MPPPASSIRPIAHAQFTPLALPMTPASNDFVRVPYQLAPLGPPPATPNPYRERSSRREHRKNCATLSNTISELVSYMARSVCIAMPKERPKANASSSVSQDWSGWQGWHGHHDQWGGDGNNGGNGSLDWQASSDTGGSSRDWWQDERGQRWSSRDGGGSSDGSKQ